MEFTLLEYRNILQQLSCPGTFVQKVARIHGMQEFLKAFDVEETQLFVRRMIGIMDSMTHVEREWPELIDVERSERIAHGSGTSRKVVLEFLRTFRDMESIMALPRNGFTTLAPGRGHH